MNSLATPKSSVSTIFPSSASLSAPATLSHAQFCISLRAFVNLKTYADDLAEDIAGDNENEHRSAEEVLLSNIDATADDNPTRFPLRPALAGLLGTLLEG